MNLTSIIPSWLFYSLTSEGGCGHGGEEVPGELQLDEVCEPSEGRGVDLPDLASDNLIPKMCLLTIPYLFTEFWRWP